jgi:hypothetical protein
VTLNVCYKRINLDGLLGFRRRDAVPCDVLLVRGVPIERHIYIVKTM